MVWCPRRRCSGERGVHQTKHQTQDGSDHLFGTDGTTWPAALPLWDHPAWLRTAAGFRFARPLYCADELPGSVGVWPDALADDFRTHASFQGAGYV